MDIMKNNLSKNELDDIMSDTKAVPLSSFTKELMDDFDESLLAGEQSIIDFVEETEQVSLDEELTSLIDDKDIIDSEQVDAPKDSIDDLDSLQTTDTKKEDGIISQEDDYLIDTRRFSRKGRNKEPEQEQKEKAFLFESKAEDAKDLNISEASDDDSFTVDLSDDAEFKDYDLDTNEGREPRLQSSKEDSSSFSVAASDKADYGNDAPKDNKDDDTKEKYVGNAVANDNVYNSDEEPDAGNLSDSDDEVFYNFSYTDKPPEIELKLNVKESSKASKQQVFLKLEDMVLISTEDKDKAILEHIAKLLKELPSEKKEELLSLGSKELRTRLFGE